MLQPPTPASPAGLLGLVGAQLALCCGVSVGVPLTAPWAARFVLVGVASSAALTLRLWGAAWAPLMALTLAAAGLGSGQCRGHAGWLGWGLVWASYAVAAAVALAQHHERVEAVGLQSFALYNAAVVCLLGGAIIAMENDREWDWDCALAVFVALMASSYVSCAIVGAGGDGALAVATRLVMLPLGMLEAVGRLLFCTLPPAV